MVSIACAGPQGCGKTAVAIALIDDGGVREEHCWYKMPIIANLSLNLPKEKYPDVQFWENKKLVSFVFDLIDNHSELEAARIMEQTFSNRILFIDEVYNILNARQTNHPINEHFLPFLSNCSKLNMVLLTTFQVGSSDMDKKVREMNELTLDCERVDEKGNLLLCMPRILQQKVMIVVTPKIFRQGLWWPFKPVLVDVSRIYSYYRTQQITILNREQFKKK